MIEGSLLAGMAFANAGVTAVHAFAYPIGSEFHIPHGVANTIMIVPVMEFNLMGNLPKFADIADIFGQNTEGLSNGRPPNFPSRRFESLPKTWMSLPG